MFHAALLIGGLLVGQVEQAATAPAADLSIQVRLLVRQLDAARLTEREEGEKRLLDMGPKVLDLLPRPTARQSAEAKLRLGRIREQIQLAAAQAGAQASTITLTGTAMPLSEVLAALQEQSGNTITDIRPRFGQQAPNPELKVDFQNTPFWVALDRVLDQAGLTVYPSGDPKTLSLIARSEDVTMSRTGPASYAGPFRIEPIRIEASRDLRRPAGESLALTLEVAWEPRIEPIGLTQPMGKVVVLDDQGNAMAVADPEAKLGVPIFGSSTASMTVPLTLPPRSVKKIASLKGTLMAMIPGPVETFSFDALTDEDLLAGKAVEKRIAGVTVALDRVRQNNSRWQIYMRVQFDTAGKALESHRGWIYDNEAYLEGPDGTLLEPDASETTGQSANGIGIAYMFALDDPPENYKFIYKTPGIIVTTEFDYEIKDVKLP